MLRTILFSEKIYYSYSISIKNHAFARESSLIGRCLGQRLHLAGNWFATVSCTLEGVWRPAGQDHYSALAVSRHHEVCAVRSQEKPGDLPVWGRAGRRRAGGGSLPHLGKPAGVPQVWRNSCQHCQGLPGQQSSLLPQSGCGSGGSHCWNGQG